MKLSLVRTLTLLLASALMAACNTTTNVDVNIDSQQDTNQTPLTVNNTTTDVTHSPTTNNNGEQENQPPKECNDSQIFDQSGKQSRRDQNDNDRLEQQYGGQRNGHLNSELHFDFQVTPLHYSGEILIIGVYSNDQRCPFIVQGVRNELLFKWAADSKKSLIDFKNEAFSMAKEIAGESAVEHVVHTVWCSPQKITFDFKAPALLLKAVLFIAQEFPLDRGVVLRGEKVEKAWGTSVTQTFLDSDGVNIYMMETTDILQIKQGIDAILDRIPGIKRRFTSGEAVLLEMGHKVPK
jgi:hypothetical protein